MTNLMIHTTAIYAVLTGILTLVLLVRAALAKNTHADAAEGSEGAKQKHLAIRGHGNLIENAPLFLILLLLADLNAASAIYLHIAGIAFTIGRVMHGVSFGFMSGHPMMRMVGISLSTLSILLLVLVNIGTLL